MNSRWTENGIELLDDRNIGIAVDTEKGLTVPVIHDADMKGIKEIASETKLKIKHAKEGVLKPEEISGSTFTITNLGMFDVEAFIPVINPPECAILGVGSIIKEPVVICDSDQMTIRPVFRLSLAFDHRIVDGAPVARFLQDIKNTIENPSFY